MQSSSWRIRALMIGAILCAGPAASATGPHDHAGDIVHFETSCNAAVQPDFDRALVLLHHMTYPQARAAFRAVADRDPDCAIAQWGIAMTLFTPLWPTRPSAADLHLGWDTVSKAKTLGHPSAREQAFLAATAEFFRDPDSRDYWQRIQRWETASASVHEAFPQDSEATAFYALALLASSRPGPSMAEHSQKAVALLLPLLEQNPRHPGAMHYVIHANDIPGREHENLDLVRRYEEIAPDNPHALHMPTHIYVRLGDWDGVIRGNLRAATAALKYPAGEHGEFVWDEFPHAIEYLVYAYLQQGEDDKADAEIKRLLATPKIEPTAKTAFHLASTRARYALERQDWKRAAKLVAREPTALDWDRYPWPEAVTWFARGYGSARIGALDESRRASARLGELDARASGAGEDVFARQIRILKLELDAWTAHAARADDGAIALMQQAVDLEGSTPKPPVTPAPTLPASEILGDLMIELGRPQDAASAYRQALQRFPKRFNSQLGAARASAATGDIGGALDEYCALMRNAPNSPRAALGEARAFVESHRGSAQGQGDAPCAGAVVASD